MSDYTRALSILIEKWRSTGLKTRRAAVDTPNLLIRGHMHGVGDGLDIAADDVEKLMDNPSNGVNPLEG